MTSFQRKSFSARCKFGPPAEAVHLGGGGVGDGGRQDGWRFVVVSHGQPYVKRSGRLRVSVDGGVVLDTELQYPPATGHGAKDPMSRCKNTTHFLVFRSTYSATKATHSR